MNEVITSIAWVIVFIGLVFNVVGCIGLVRMPNVYAGLQSAAKCVMLGTCAILLGVFLMFVLPVPPDAANAAAVQPRAPVAVRAIVCMFFLVVTVPAAAHALARAAHRSGIHVAEGAQVVDKYEEEVIQHPEKSEIQ